ncbi:MAG: hypothetical protein AAFV95_11245 [Bacteroidota bacterium]
MDRFSRHLSLGKLSCLLGLLAILVFLYPRPVAEACGPEDYSFQGYSFLDPVLLEADSTFGPYFIEFQDLYHSYRSQSAVQAKGNLEEWQEVFCGLVKQEDLSKIIYDSRLDQLQLLRTSIYSKTLPLDFTFAKNSFARHMKLNGCTETIDYLIFAKRCEPHVTASDPWAEAEKDTLAMKRLIKDGRKIFRKTKSNYLRLRYAYQLIRLAHYAKDYPLTLELYDWLLPKIDPVESILYDWILGHKAGALAAMGQQVEAAYYFLKIFKNCPSKRMSAFQSFQVRTDEDWRAVLLLCEDDEERATLYALRAQRRDSRIVEEMKSIYELSPESEQLELLLVREIRKLEKDLLGLEFNDRRRENKRYHNIPRKYAGLNLVRLDSLVRRVIREEKVPRLSLWELANGYLEFLGGDLYAAEKTFQRIRPRLNNEQLEEQLSAFELALKVTSLERMNSVTERKVFDIITQDPSYKKYADFPDFVNDRVGALYARQGHPGKSFRFHYNLRDLMPNPQLDIIDDLLAVCEKEDINLLEEALIIDEQQNSVCNQLLDMKGTKMFADGELEIALETFKQIPLSYRDTFQANPFAERVFDECIHCPPTDTVFFNKAEIIQRIFELEYRGKADLERGADWYYELGTAYLNMSYFGNSWQVLDHFRSGANWRYDKDGVYYLWFAPYDNREYQGLSQALLYFQKAIELATDDELAAKAAYMAARCEHYSWYVSRDCDYSIYSNRIPEPPPSYQTYFRLLRENYSGTQFFQEAIRECRYFEAYAIQ